MTSTFIVSTSGCMTCNNQVLKTLGTLQGIFGAEMDMIEGRIVVSHTDEVSRSEIADMLGKLGFTEKVIEQQQEVETDEPSIWGCAL